MFLPQQGIKHDVKDSLHEDLERVFDAFLKYHKKTLLRDINARVGREHIFIPTSGKLEVTRN
jgi:hypothetical protein